MDKLDDWIRRKVCQLAIVRAIEKKEYKGEKTKKKRPTSAKIIQS